MKNFSFFHDASKKLRLQLLQLMAEGLVTLLVIGMLGNITFGWFSQNKEVTAQGMSVTVNAPDIQVTYTPYRYDLNTQTVVDTDHLDTLNMPTYDLIFDKLNKYTPMALRLGITGALDPAGTITVTISRNPNVGGVNDPVNSTRLTDRTSSVIRFTGATCSAPTASGGAPLIPAGGVPLKQTISGIYEYAKPLTQADNGPGTVTFTTFSGTDSAPSYTKVENITLEIPYTQKDFVTGADGSPVLQVFVLFTYDTQLTNKFHRQYSSIDQSHDVTLEVKVINDISNISISKK